MTTDLNIHRHLELGVVVLVDVVVADVQVLLVPDVVDGHEANPACLEAGGGVRRCGGVEVRVVHEHADVLKRRVD